MPPFVCCILDDASTDGEPEVIRDYLKKNFDLEDKSVARKEETNDFVLYFAQHKTNKNCYFAVYLLKYNHYSAKKAKMPYYILWDADVEYIAYCEGDDYWNDARKLELQVSAMEKHPGINISAHAFSRFHAITGELVDERCLSLEEKVFTTEQVIMGEGGFVGTATLMTRQSGKINQYPFRMQMPYDYTLQIAGSLNGGLLYIPENMTYRRVSVPGSFTVRNRAANKQGWIDYANRRTKMLVQLDADTNGKYHDIIYSRILLNSIRSYRSASDNRHLLCKYRDGLRCLPIIRRLRMLILCYSFGLSWIYRRIRYGKQ